MEAIRLGLLSSLLFLIFVVVVQLGLPPTSSGLFVTMAHAQNYNCETPPVDEPDNDGDECNPGYQTQLDLSKNIGGPSDDTNTCPLTCGNPINFATGNKFQREDDYTGNGSFPLVVSRYYNSQVTGNFAFGANWRSAYSRSISATSSTALVTRDDGKVLTFTLSNGVWTPDADVNSKLVKTANGWTYTTGRDETETYNANGQLVSFANRAGLVQTFSYDSNGNLYRVTDPFSRHLTFLYAQAAGGWRVYQVVDSAGGSYQYSYDANNNLISVMYPGSSRRQYVYENSAFPHALTGIIDEDNNRYATYAYDSSGRAISTQHAGGAELYTVNYNYLTLGYVDVTNPLGASYTYYLDAIDGSAVPDVEIRTCSTCSFSGSVTLTTHYDANGNVSSRMDFNGNTTTYSYDLTRNLEVSRTEAAGTPQARTITTQWHPTFRLPTQITEPNRVTTFSYDAHGNLLQKTVTAGSLTRTWTYTYNANGQVLTIDGPRTDISDVTTLAYDVYGNLITITNALGQATQISYDTSGRPVTFQDPNALVTSLTYDGRSRVTSVYVAGLLMNYTYDAAGNLTMAKFSQDGSYTSYTYDAAHRLTGVADGHGNHISYTVDASGNRTLEQVYNPSNTLTQTRSHVYDGLSRLAQDIGALNQTTSYAYDNNGNRTAVTDPLSHTTTNFYDALNRVIRVVDPNSQLTTYSYDANDQLTGVADPRLLPTSYTYDGLGNQTTLTSPDTGTTSRTFDAAGNVITATDARSKTTTYTYDALNRLTSASFADGKVITYQYDQGNKGKGHLTGITDPSGSTTWSYDFLGHVTSKRQQTGNIVLTTNLSYDGAGHLTTITYPSGRVVNVSYNSDQVSSVSSSGVTLAGAVAYQPLGAVAGWTANGNSYSRSFDQDGRISGFGVSSGAPFTATLAYDAASRITSITDTVLPSKTFGYDNLDRLTSYQTSTVNQSYVYDADGNRLSLASGGTTSYNYAATSNQLLGSSGAVAQTFGYDAAGNVLTNNTSTVNYSYVYDASGRMVTTNAGANATTYTLNGFGQRVIKSGYGARSIAGGSEIFVYDVAGHLMGEYDATGHVIQETVWLGSLPVAVFMPNQTYLVYPDHLGSPRAIAATNNAIVWTWDHDPFGNGQPTGGITYNVRFPGQYYDNETNFHYNYYRDYNPATGRYSESDPIGLAGGVNTYTYVGGNPLSRIDPLGLDWQFSQSTGQWTHIDNQTGAQTNVGTGYSGTGAGRNNPAMQDVPNVGPIPQGSYDIGSAYNNPNTGPMTMNLTPRPGTDTFGRDLFRIHGNNAANDASQGCPIASPNLRSQINNSPDRVLHVVP